MPLSTVTRVPPGGAAPANQAVLNLNVATPRAINLTQIVTQPTAPLNSFSVVQETSGTTGTTTPTTYSVTLPNPTAGNSVVIIVSSDATVATPSGFVVDRSQVNGNGH